MGALQDTGSSSKWRFYGWEPFRMDLMVTKGDE